MPNLHERTEQIAQQLSILELGTSALIAVNPYYLSQGILSFLVPYSLGEGNDISFRDKFDFARPEINPNSDDEIQKLYILVTRIIGTSPDSNEETPKVRTSLFEKAQKISDKISQLNPGETIKIIITFEDYDEGLIGAFLREKLRTQGFITRQLSELFAIEIIEPSRPTDLRDPVTCTFTRLTTT